MLTSALLQATKSSFIPFSRDKKMAAVPVAAAIVAPQFAYVHGATAFIGYGTSECLKLYKAVKTPVNNLFDCSPWNLKVYLSALGDCTGEYGWGNDQDVPEDATPPAH